jgi:replicative DNA helicase
VFSDELAEYRLLACIIDDPELVFKLTHRLFTGNRVQVFQAMREAYKKYGQLTSEGVEGFFGGPLPLEIEAARGAKAAALVERLSELAIRRQLVDISNRVTNAAMAGITDRKALSQIMQIEPVVSSQDSSLAPGIAGFITDLRRKMTGQYEFVDTGIPFLNYMLGGEWPRQALTVVMGQAGGGKTALVCQSILNMAKMGIPSLFVSLEMPKYRIISRFAANLAEVDGMRLRSGKLEEEEVQRVDAAIKEIQSLPIYIIDKPGMTAEDITYEVTQHRELFGVQAFFVDYLQIVGRSLGKDNDSEELGHMAQMIRNIAVSTDIAAVALSQQNRQFKGLSSILGSGRISHIADSVFEIELGESHSDDQRPCTFHVHKNRDGAVGMTNALYRPRYLRFE